MSLLEQATALYVRLRDMDWQGRKDALKEVPEALADAYYAYRKDRMYDPENALPNPKEFLSPSGRYKLVVTSFTSGPGTWNVTEGKVYRVDSDTPIASIRRNYSAFPYCFIEQHANGHDYLIGGEDYQGQTVIELDTGVKRGLLPEEAKQGHGFCWGSYVYNANAQVLFVDGCYWAAPYEFRFYDFSDPMNGWPLLEYCPADEEDGEAYVESDGKDPTFEEDGTLITYQTKFGKPGDDDDDEEEDHEGNKRERKVVATRTWKRDGLKLKEIAFWVDAEEQAERDRRAEANRKWNEAITNYKATDPLYLKMKELAAQEPFKPADYMSIGQTYAKWCPGFEGNEQRMCMTIHSAGTFRAEMEIAEKTGPVKLTLKNSKGSQERFFMEHSVASIELVFEAARDFLAGDP